MYKLIKFISVVSFLKVPLYLGLTYMYSGTTLCPNNSRISFSKQSIGTKLAPELHVRQAPNYMYVAVQYKELELDHKVWSVLTVLPSPYTY